VSPVARICVVTFSLAIGFILLGAVLVTVADIEGNAAVLRYPFRLLCHGKAERCLVLSNRPMPICSRCVGIYAGAMMSLGLFAATSRQWNRGIASRAVLLLMIPLLVDGITQAVGLRESNNNLRLGTGLLAGLAGMAWVVSRLPQIGWKDRDSTNTNRDFPP